MTLAAGVRLGPYEILSPLGEGGMGEVYLARDTRLERQVAVKVLHEGVSADRSRLDRFEKEAKAASALNHPNIVTTYDAGTSDAVSWIAMEYVSGQTFRAALIAGPMPFKRVLTLAVQVADGLAAAHEAGIVHRDIKPENLILAKNDLVKVVDFGLAKLGPIGPGEGVSQRPAETATFPGTILGTVAYMSPEQARGQSVDFRSDQFSFGAVLYELTTGARPFRRATAVETLSAILNEEPLPIAEVSPRTPVPMRWIIERCLAKEPANRYASTQDLAQDLRGLRDRLPEASTASFAATELPRPGPSRARLATALVLAAALAALAGAFALGKRAGETPVPEFQRLTFRRGAILGARFAPDGRTIVYSAAWDGGPLRLYTARTDGAESTALGPTEMDIAAISTFGEMALVARSFGSPVSWLDPGTLARMPLAGGAPREMTEGVVSADWSPDGKTLAISRETEDGGTRLEFPIGKVLYRSKDSIHNVRLSPSGDRIAFVETRLSSQADVLSIDLSGRARTVSSGWKRCFGLAWSPDGSEIWFSGNERGWRTPLRAVKPGGVPRVVLRLPSWTSVQDVAPDGRVLVSLVAMRTTMRVRVAGEAEERDLSWHEGSFAKGLTPDGKVVLFDEGAEGEFHAIYVRPTDGSPARRIGEGRSMAISADGRWVAANAGSRGTDVVLLPTGAGESRVLDSGGHRFEEASFLPDGRRLVLLAGDKGHRPQTFLGDLNSGKLRPAAAEGLACLVVSPDSRELACTGTDVPGTVVSLEGGASRPIPGLRKEEKVLQWSQDGRSLFVANTRGASIPVFRLDLATGQRELWRELRPVDRAALSEVYDVAITPDGKSYAYSNFNLPSELYLVKGLR